MYDMDKIRAFRQLFTDSEYVLIIDVLERWGKGEIPKDKSAGICKNLWDISDSYEGAYDLVSLIAPHWRFYSGSTTHPVPSTHIIYNEPVHAYDNFKLWGKSQYAGLRRELCLFMARQIRKYLDESKSLSES